MVNLLILLLHLFLVVYCYYKFSVFERKAFEARFVLEKINKNNTPLEDVETVIVKESKVIKAKFFFFDALFWKYNPRLRHDLIYRSVEYVNLLDEFKRNRNKSIFAIFLCFLFFCLLLPLINYYEEVLAYFEG